jgi:Cu2+-containing amine oxidase
VLNWKPGEPSARAAFIIIKQGNRTYEATVVCSIQNFESRHEVKGVQPSILYEEMQHLTDILKTQEGEVRCANAARARSVRATPCHH